MRTLPFILLTAVLAACAEGQLGPPDPDIRPEFQTGQIGSPDAAEETHLVFMREEEKLARDVYITLGEMYSDLKTFDRIDDAEQKHTDTMADLLALYAIEDPSTKDKVGVFTGEDYGGYFTEKYEYLVDRGGESGLEALYVGAFIEELDMNDIVHCPQVIIDMDNDIEEDGCGLVYTDETVIIRVYESLVEGSKSHLRAYVRSIEKIIGEGNYVAQVLPQTEVDEILGR